MNTSHAELLLVKLIKGTTKLKYKFQRKTMVTVLNTVDSYIAQECAHQPTHT